MTMLVDHEALIDITTVDLREFIQDVYAVSTPSGLDAVLAAQGKDGPLTPEEIDNILACTGDDNVLVLNMAVVNGRSCYMKVFWSKDAGMAIKNNWPDHNYGTLLSLLKKHDIHIDQHGDHHVNCLCRACKPYGRVHFGSPCCGKASRPRYYGRAGTAYICPCGNEWKP